MYEKTNIIQLTEDAWALYENRSVCFCEESDDDGYSCVTRLPDAANGNRQYMFALYDAGETQDAVLLQRASHKEVFCFKELRDAISEELEHPDGVLYKRVPEPEDVPEYTVAFRVTGRVHIHVRGAGSVSEAVEMADEICNEADFGSLEDIEYEVRWAEGPDGKRTEM